MVLSPADAETLQNHDREARACRARKVASSLDDNFNVWHEYNLEMSLDHYPFYPIGRWERRDSKIRKDRNPHLFSAIRPGAGQFLRGRFGERFKRIGVCAWSAPDSALMSPSEFHRLFGWDGRPPFI
jgi:hypothetical protein